ncbi:hypothetical protein ACWD4F_07475 [Streptomyces aureus]|uniref:Uncharacterized protein n=1 Tax=Streptomyces triticiradicis TaxID=2651189 RepID=A0A7J5DMA1_9ACTN|nr:hypothetical protein [Streptomyces triticiradicis]KAB1989829.1 hypothetical protein F8144_05645 [Streptomyces triticiradicis]
MPARPPTPVINTPEHHFAATFLVIATRQPDDATLRAAVSLIDHAVIAAWALRPDDLVVLTQQQYRQLIDYTAASQVLDLALYLGGDRKKIRSLMDHIDREIAELLTHYTPPTPQT